MFHNFLQGRQLCDCVPAYQVPSDKENGKNWSPKEANGFLSEKTALQKGGKGAKQFSRVAYPESVSIFPNMLLM